MKEIEDFRLVSSNLLSSLDFGLRMSLQMFSVHHLTVHIKRKLPKYLIKTALLTVFLGRLS